MSLIYALIAKNKNIVLSEYTDYNGNFQQITREILENLNPENKTGVINYKK